AIFGSVEIDLSEALFDHQQVVIKAFSVFGNVEVRVPENVSLRGLGGGVLGNFEVASLDAEDPEAPVVYVDGWAVLGNVEARPKRGQLVADIMDTVQRSLDRAPHRGMRKHLGHCRQARTARPLLMISGVSVICGACGRRSPG